MKIEKVFGTNVVRVMCEQPEWYQNEVAVNSLERLFRRHSKDAPEIVGKVQTSLTSPMPVEMLPGLENLIDWVKKQIMMAAPSFVNFTPTGFQFDMKRTWANKMYRGSQVLPHTHDVVAGSQERRTNNSHGVAIFYLQMPEHSSDLVFMEGETVHHANVKQGELVFHTKDVLHAVTEHQSDIPRICLVFEFTYIS